MTRVIARCPFRDLEAESPRSAGERWDCSEERARHLAALGLVAVAKEQPKKAAPKKKKTE